MVTLHWNMRLLAGETIAKSVHDQSISVMRCAECGQDAVRLLLIAPANSPEIPEELTRKVALCKEHFLDACILFPELRSIERSC